MTKLTETGFLIWLFAFIGSTLISASPLLATEAKIDITRTGQIEYREAVLQKLKDPRLFQGMINAENYPKIVKIAEQYKLRNSINPGWLNVFRTWNSGETLQNRTALENKRTGKTLIFDMDGAEPLDWSAVKFSAEQMPSTSDSQYALALDTTNITERQSPVILLLLSNQHVLNDYLSNNTAAEIKRMGITLAVMEYPGFGVSVGQSSKKSWIEATQNAVKYLNSLTGKKIYLLGHSIGGPLALETAATERIKSEVAGVMSYGGFTDLAEQSKDQDGNAIITFFAPLITELLVGSNIIDGMSGLVKLAKAGIPALIMHGQLDGPVPVRHLELYAEKISEIRGTKQRPTKLANAVLETKAYAGLAHEEVNNFSRGVETSEKNFNVIWSDIRKFVGLP